MKKSLGISRNRFELLQAAKNDLVRRKNIFKYIGKEDELSENENQENSNHLISATTKNSAHSVEIIDSNPTLQVYQQAKSHLLQVTEYKKKMMAQIKLRMASFKQSQIKIYDQNISKYSSKAVDVRISLCKHLLKSEKILIHIRQLKGNNQTEHKFYRNMEKSLALEVRQASKSLRTQEKEYFDRLRAYQTGTANLAIQLNQQDRQKMKDQFQDMQVCETEISDNLQKNKQITDLVKSINQLNGIYKQLNELVIEQGSLIDRIDYNIQQTYQHVQKGVKHLQGANEKAQSPCARKCMCFLIIAILIMSVVVGFKLSNSTPK